ncbi:MAG TPA: TlpA disulfide reductase family protein [Noviherbaspirillum sp.]
MKTAFAWFVNWKRFLLLAAFAVAAGAAYVWQSRPPAPDVAFVTLKGETVTMRELRGKVVYVNFWATSCATCIKEMPDIVNMYTHYASRGFDLLAVAMYYDPPNYVAAYTAIHKLPFKVILDTTGKIATAFGGVMATPTALLIDKRGRILRRFVGEPDFAALHSTIENELASHD